VSDLVSVLVGKNSDNMQFACPIDNAPIPSLGVASDLSYQILPRGPNTLRELQIQEDVVTCACPQEGESGVRQGYSEWALTQCMGEEILSLRPLLRRNYPVQNIRQSTKGIQTVRFQPDQFNLYDPLSLISRMYLFWRGGLRYKFMRTPGVRNQSLTLLALDPSRNDVYTATLNQGLTSAGAGTFFPIAPVAAVDQGVGLGLEFEVPFYNKYRVRTVSPGLNSTIDDATPRVVDVNGNFEQPNLVFRSTDDNFTFGYFLGTPQISVVNYTMSAISLPNVAPTVLEPIDESPSAEDKQEDGEESSTYEVTTDGKALPAGVIQTEGERTVVVLPE
jgi:hypothetical protein